MTWLAWAIFVNSFIIGFVIGTVSTRERRLPSHELLTSRVDQSWVVSVGADTSQALTADTTHNSPPAPPRKTFTGGAPEPREGSDLSSPPRVRHHFFRIG